jgi:GNAT superfamily N-acetyltransferase
VFARPAQHTFVPINAREIFQRYRAERRGQTYPGMQLEQLPRFSRYVAESAEAGGFVVFAELAPEGIEQAIKEQVAHFRQLGQRFEWKVYDFDSPPTLKQRLEEQGFRQSDAEAFLVLEPKNWNAPRGVPAGVTIEKVTSRDQLRDFVAAELAVGFEGASEHLEKYTRELAAASEMISIYCAYADGRPVGTGRVTFPAQSTFADLNGGGVVADMRGRGIFTALLNRRIEEAKARGYEWIAVDAAPMSRPILLRKGFQHVCWTYPMIREKS